jgi:MFS family permease
MATFSVMSFASGPLYERLGGKILLCAGAACLPIGVLLLSLVHEDSGYVALVPGFVVAGLGVGLFYSTITTVAVTALDQSRASLAGGVIYMFQVAGGSIGLGLTTTIFTATALSHIRSEGIAGRLDDDQVHAIGNVLSGADSGQQVTRAFPEVAARLEQLARDAFVAGVHTALRVDAALAAAGFLVVLLFVGGRLRGRHQPVVHSGVRPPGEPAARRPA